MNILKLKYAVSKQAFTELSTKYDEQKKSIDQTLNSDANERPSSKNYLGLQLLPVLFGGNELMYLRTVGRQYALVLGSGFYKLQNPPFSSRASYLEALRVETGMRLYSSHRASLYQQFLFGFKQAYMRDKEVRFDDQRNEIIGKSWGKSLYGLAGAGLQSTLLHFVYIDIFAGLGLNFLISDQNVVNIDYGTLYPLKDQAFVRLSCTLGVHF